MVKEGGQANGSLSQGGNFGAKEIYLEFRDRKQKNVALPEWATVEGGGHPPCGVAAARIPAVALPTRLSLH